MCYRARLQKREEFDEEISACFVNPIALTKGSPQLRAEIRWLVLVTSLKAQDVI